jgi:hypothetical protein
MGSVLKPQITLQEVKVKLVAQKPGKIPSPCG